MLIGSAHFGEVLFQPRTELAGAGARVLHAVLETLVERLGKAEDLFEHPAMQRAQAHELVAALLLSVGSNYSEAVSRGRALQPLQPRSLRRAREYIDAHLGDPISLGGIATATGYSARTLSSAFREHLGTTPMRYVRDRRLDRLRRQLTESSDSVSTAAARCGFAHLGRVSAAYCARFGELPSDTVRRR
jgi:transcriptional regulator GlxA family with amidase domain